MKIKLTVYELTQLLNTNQPDAEAALEIRRLMKANEELRQRINELTNQPQTFEDFEKQRNAEEFASETGRAARSSRPTKKKISSKPSV